MEKDEIDLNFAKKLNDVAESVRQNAQEKNRQLIETRYYKEFEINTNNGPLVLNDVFITIERNKEGDMEYHFRWAKENEQGEMTIEEKMIADKNGDVYSVDGLREYFENSKIDIESMISENDKEKGRLLGIAEEGRSKENDNEKGKENNEPKNDEQEKKKVEGDLKKDDDQKIEVSIVRRITDNHLHERNPEVFKENSEYALAEKNGIPTLTEKEQVSDEGDEGKVRETWKEIDNLEVVEPVNYRSIISISEDGNKIERKVPYLLLRTNMADKEIAITLEAKNYGEFGIETVDVMPCQERVSRQVRMAGQGIEGEETPETRRDFKTSGTKAHEVAHGFKDAEQAQKENGETVDPSTIDENTPIPDSDMTWGELSEETGENILKLVERYNRENDEMKAKGEKPESKNIIQIIIDDYRAVSHERKI